MSERRLWALIKRLDEYAGHTSSCSFHRSSSELSCTCGYRDVMEEMEALKKAKRKS